MCLVLQRLIVSSLAEDSLGTVQRDIPKILEAFSTYLTVVEQTKEALVSTINPDAPEELRIDLVKAINALDTLRSGPSLPFLFQNTDIDG